MFCLLGRGRKHFAIQIGGPEAVSTSAHRIGKSLRQRTLDGHNLFGIDKGLLFNNAKLLKTILLVMIVD